eukprot:2477131-Pyramimonas_sp.AAC.1
MGDPNRACDLLRDRVLATVAMYQLELKRRNLNDETLRHELAVCAACKAGRCKNCARCRLLRAGYSE